MASRDFPVNGGPRPRDPFTVDKARTLEALTLEWGGLFHVTYAGDRWQASRTDGTGDTLLGLTPDDLVAAMRSALAAQ
jgi:hypothetical protein